MRLGEAAGDEGASSAAVKEASGVAAVVVVGVASGDAE